MKTFYRCLLSCVFLFALVLGATSFAQSNESAIIPGKSIALFDGNSFAGWTFVTKGTNEEAAAIWSVRDGVIACQGKPNGYARTLQSYHDYQLHVEWRFPDGRGNSGVFVHLNPPDTVWPLCYEAQLQTGTAGELRLNGGALIHGLPETNARSLPHREPGAEKPTGEWNECDIVCRSNSIVIRINGVLQNDVSGLAIEAGAIGLQAEGKPVEFRNIRIAPLPSR